MAWTALLDAVERRPAQAPLARALDEAGLEARDRYEVALPHPGGLPVAHKDRQEPVPGRASHGNGGGHGAQDPSARRRRIIGWEIAIGLAALETRAVRSHILPGQNERRERPLRAGRGGKAGREQDCGREAWRIRQVPSWTAAGRRVWDGKRQPGLTDDGNGAESFSGQWPPAFR